MECSEVYLYYLMLPLFIGRNPNMTFFNKRILFAQLIITMTTNSAMASISYTNKETNLDGTVSYSGLQSDGSVEFAEAYKPTGAEPILGMYPHKFKCKYGQRVSITSSKVCNILGHQSAVVFTLGKFISVLDPIQTNNWYVNLAGGIDGIYSDLVSLRQRRPVPLAPSFGGITNIQCSNGVAKIEKLTCK